MARKLRLKIIACGVFEDELRAIAARSANDISVELLDAGLHAAPDKLRLRAQEAIDAASRAGGYDAICFAYGLCGRGTVGLVARQVPLVIPRVHDCISLFLGSARAYAEQFSRHPGTFYFTTGWYKHKAHPELTRMAALRRFDPTAHPHYRELADKHGEDNARYIVQFLESWRRNYRRAALIDHGFATAEQRETTKAIAEAAGWDYERLEGSLALLEAMAAGDWDAERFLIVEPGHVVVATNDERVLTALRLERAAGGADVSEAFLAEAEDSIHRVATGTFLYGEARADHDAAADVGLGIDAGGTFTDAVLYEFRTGKLLCKAKAITTHYDLVEGIREALSGLDAPLFSRVSYTCLSTTLATNAIVEGRGLPVGLILMPHHERACARIKTPFFRCISARMTIEGIQQAPVEEEEVLRAAREMLKEGAASFAVSGFGSVRNPAHELQVRDILRAHCELPVVCGHELSARLDFVARAHTAVLNARLLPFITDLLRSVEHVLARAGIGGPLFVVRGDGSIMRGEVARTRAIETVLSGPAASAAGGRLLTGRKNALVLDMGGTTTDIAALDDGRMTLSREGARVGHWRTSVTAADIQTTGLGGDSSVRPAGGLRVQIGPERVVPLCFLAAQWPGVLDELASLSTQQLVGSMVPDEFDFFLLVGRPAGLGLDAHEHKIVELLAERPHSRPSLGRACGLLAPQLLRVRRLELIGLVRRAGVTPTDALHVLGEYARYDEDAARLGMRILGRFLGLDETATAELVKAEVERQLALAIMRHELSSDGAGRSPQEFEKVRGLLERALEGNGAEPFRLRWSQLRPVVGIGAPVGAFLPGACRMLGTDAIIPPDADVANALGAVTSRIVVGARIRIRPGEFGSYILYAPDGRAEFSRLEDAERAARERVVEFVRTKARGFGTAEEQVRVEVSRRVGRLQDGSTQLLEVEVEATLSGPPALARAGNA
jgi:N-methylhydantoinase A/oxoprolinase/acetone carboxylase beta subunit